MKRQMVSLILILLVVSSTPGLCCEGFEMAQDLLQKFDDPQWGTLHEKDAYYGVAGDGDAATSSLFCMQENKPDYDWVKEYCGPKSFTTLIVDRTHVPSLFLAWLKKTVTPARDIRLISCSNHTESRPHRQIIETQVGPDRIQFTQNIDPDVRGPFIEFIISEINGESIFELHRKDLANGKVLEIANGLSEWKLNEDD